MNTHSGYVCVCVNELHCITLNIFHTHIIFSSYFSLNLYFLSLSLSVVSLLATLKYIFVCEVCESEREKKQALEEHVYGNSHNDGAILAGYFGLFVHCTWIHTQARVYALDFAFECDIKYDAAQDWQRDRNHRARQRNQDI